MMISDEVVTIHTAIYQWCYEHSCFRLSVVVCPIHLSVCRIDQLIMLPSISSCVNYLCCSLSDSILTIC